MKKYKTKGILELIKPFLEQDQKTVAEINKEWWELPESLRWLSKLPPIEKPEMIMSHKHSLYFRRHYLNEPDVSEPRNKCCSEFEQHNSPAVKSMTFIRKDEEPKEESEVSKFLKSLVPIDLDKE